MIEDPARGAAEQQTGEAAVAAAADDEHRRTVLVAGLHESLPHGPFGQFLDDFHDESIALSRSHDDFYDQSPASRECAKSH